MDFAGLSSNFLYVTFIAYLIASVIFWSSIGKKDKKKTSSNWTKIGIIITVIGFIAQVASFIFRWLAAGHIPIGNMFEFISFFGMCLILAFLVIYFIYKETALGLVALPLTMLIIGYGSMFPREISPLVPSLQSHWLYIHVTLAALAEAILAISFFAGLIYLIVKIDQTRRSKQTFWLEVIMYSIFSTLAFIILVTSFSAAGYNVEFSYEQNGETYVTEYQLPALFEPDNSTLITEDAFTTGIEVPGWMQGADAGRKFNTLVWSLLGGLVIYGLIRLITRKRVAQSIQPWFKRVNLDRIDEIIYRSVAIGFPLFTLGALIFAAIWAEQAWGRFWGWDPKEVWALITWFFYAAFLHLRLTRGWHGERSAWLAVVGFAIIMFNLIVVNLLLAGLHSYA